ncbi:MAG: glycosyltransferase family 4 protein [Cyanobacteria bacterium P01_F01_bin.86]
MKILLVNDYGTPTGGAELLMLALRDGLRQRGHDARLFATGVSIGAHQPQADYTCIGTTSSWRTLLQSGNPWAMGKLRQVLRAFQPDVVHVKIFLTQLSPLILPLLKSFPSLYYVAWYRPICPLGNKILPDGSPCQDPYGAACYRHRCLPLHDWLPLMAQMRQWQHWRRCFSRVVANSYAVQRQLGAAGIETHGVIECGVPVRPMRPNLVSVPTVVFAGRLVREKGVDVLVKAFARVRQDCPEARLLIAGDGSERDRLHALVNQLNLADHVDLLGHLPQAEMEQRFRQAWVQAVPSRWAEPFGMVAAEAMMRGTAVVATAAGGLAEVVQDPKTGILVPPESVEQLAHALRRLLRDRVLAEQMGQTGREVALAQFSATVFVDKFIQQYEELLENPVTLERSDACAA